MKIYTSDQLIAALKEAGFTEIQTYSNTKNHWISIVATKQPISSLSDSQQFNIKLIQANMVKVLC